MMIFLVIPVVVVLWAPIGFLFANFGYAAIDINHDTFLQSRRHSYRIDEDDYILMFILIVLLPVGIMFGVCGMVGKLGAKVFG